MNTKISAALILMFFSTSFALYCPKNRLCLNVALDDYSINPSIIVGFREEFRPNVFFHEMWTFRCPNNSTVQYSREDIKKGKKLKCASKDHLGNYPGLTDIDFHAIIKKNIHDKGENIWGLFVIEDGKKKLYTDSAGTYFYSFGNKEKKALIKKAKEFNDYLKNQNKEHSDIVFDVAPISAFHFVYKDILAIKKDFKFANDSNSIILAIPPNIGENSKRAKKILNTFKSIFNISGINDVCLVFIGDDSLYNIKYKNATMNILQKTNLHNTKCSNNEIAWLKIDSSKYKENQRKNLNEYYSSAIVNSFQNKCTKWIENNILLYISKGGDLPTWSNIGAYPDLYSIPRKIISDKFSIEYTAEGCKQCLSCEEPTNGLGYSLTLKSDLPNSDCSKGITLIRTFENDSLQPYKVESSQKNECVDIIKKELISRYKTSHKADSHSTNFNKIFNTAKEEGYIEPRYLKGYPNDIFEDIEITHYTNRSISDIAEIIREYSQNLRLILKKFVLKDTSFQGGSNTFWFTIAPGGEVISITITSSTTGSKEFDQEIKNTISNWIFNKVSSQNTTVIATFSFSIDGIEDFDDIEGVSPENEMSTDIEEQKEDNYE